MDAYFNGLWLVRLLVQRGLAAIYLLAFVSALFQFRPLLGENGLLPVPRYLERVSFREAPSVFHFHYSDRFFGVVAWLGIGLSLLALLGISESGPVWLSMAVWLALFVLYLSIVNVGQTFYAFGWESMLLEAGFFASFLGPAGMEPSLVPVLILRWMLFRVELGAGLIKLRHDECWRKLTCLFYHHETQPLPNPLSSYFHALPKPVHKAGVVFSHFVQLVAPFGLFLPQPYSALAGALIVVHQLMLIVSGNYAWLNWLTVVLGVTAFSDQELLRLLPMVVPETAPRSQAFDVLLYGIAMVTLVLSVKPTLNLISKNQLMNYNYNSLHLVGTYGAFGSVTKKRYEVVLEGTLDEEISPSTKWKAYEFKAKPGPLGRRPPQIAPYHLRLDWLMWFLPFSVFVVNRRALPMRGYDRWFMVLVRKLLAADAATLRLLSKDPFAGQAPRHVRASYFRYEFTSRAERKKDGNWWKRRKLGEYLPPVSAGDLESAGSLLN